MESNADTKPPYGGFRSFWNFISQLHEHRPLPQILDRSVMGTRGGSSRSELYTTLRFLHLIDNEKRPTAPLDDLTADPTAEKLRPLIETHYAPVINVGLANATPRQVDEALLALGSTPATVQRARTFFLHAAEEAGIEVGRPLKTAPRGHGGGTTRRRRPKQVKEPTDQNGQQQFQQTKLPATGLPQVIGALVAKLPTEAEGWNEEDARDWLALARLAIAFDYKLDGAKLKQGGP